jgi:hypothetical protein
VGPRAGLDVVQKRKFLTLPGLQLRSLGRPSRNILFFLLFVRWDFGYCDHYWAIVSDPDDGDCGEIGGIMIAGETEVLGENLPQRHLSITNPT